MKKLSLLLSAFFLSACATQNYSSPQKEVHRTKVPGAYIENLVPYKHPRAKKEGDLMPQPIIGREVPGMSLWTNKDGVEAEIGEVFSYDGNNDGIPDYEFIIRFCDAGKGVKPYAAHDAPHKLLYVDLDRNGEIDMVRNLNSLEEKSFMLPMIKRGCKQEEKNKTKK